MIPQGPATHFAEMLLFAVSALEHAGIEYVIHYGTLLGAARLGTPLPWDEDHDIFLPNISPDAVREKLEDVFRLHGFCLTSDPRGFFWVREKLWPAGAGHVAIELLPPLVQRVEDLPVWDGGAPHLLTDELRPRVKLPIHSSFVWAPHGTEPLLARLYGRSGTPEAMKAFIGTPMRPEADAFWSKARTPESLDWAAISKRFRQRSRWKHLLNAPWWWFNGGYNVVVKHIRGLARKAGPRAG
jgi:hypothetical protein